MGTVFRKYFTSYFYILIGSLLLALGLRLFLVPVKISPGGVSSIATVFLYLFRVPLSITTLLANAVLFVFGYKFLGKTGILKTVAGVLFSSLFLALFSSLPVYRDDILVSALIGGLFSGTGIGLCVRQEASTGGSDFAALLLNRFFPHISVSLFILAIDCVIILAAGLVFRSITISAYSAISLFISMKATDLILSFGDAAKSIFILSEKTTEISAEIQNRFQRSTTGIYSRGMYEGENRLMLLSVVSPKELPALMHLVRRVDRDAFIIVSDAREVLGEGFKSGTKYDIVHDKKKPNR